MQATIILRTFCLLTFCLCMKYYVIDLAFVLFGFVFDQTLNFHTPSTDGVWNRAAGLKDNPGPHNTVVLFVHFSLLKA